MTCTEPPDLRCQIEQLGLNEYRYQQADIVFLGQMVEAKLRNARPKETDRPDQKLSERLDYMAAVGNESFSGFKERMSDALKFAEILRYEMIERFRVRKVWKGDIDGEVTMRSYGHDAAEYMWRLPDRNKRNWPEHGEWSVFFLRKEDIKLDNAIYSLVQWSDLCSRWPVIETARQETLAWLDDRVKLEDNSPEIPKFNRKECFGNRKPMSAPSND